MARFGTLRDFRFTNSAEDIRGSKLYGLNDEKLGKIDDVIFDYSSGLINYIVVDTGGWLSTKKFIVPAERLQMSAEHQDDFAVDLNKRQIESFPPYDESALESDQQWADYEGRYRSKWEISPIMHRAETDRNITPTARQMPVNPMSTRAEAEADVAAAGSPSGRVVPAGSDSVVISNSAVGIGGRWDTFQSRLRERRKQAAGMGTATQAESEGDTWRKAV